MPDSTALVAAEGRNDFAVNFAQSSPASFIDSLRINETVVDEIALKGLFSETNTGSEGKFSGDFVLFMYALSVVLGSNFGSVDFGTDTLNPSRHVSFFIPKNVRVSEPSVLN